MTFHVYDASGRLKSAQAIAEIADIGDVTITSVADDELLAYDSTAVGWINQTAAEAGLATDDHTHAVDDLSDATITAVGDGELLVYDTDAFVNKTAVEASICKWLGKSTADVTNPPSDAELDAAFGAPATVGYAAGIVDDNDAGTAIYLVVSDGTNWFTVQVAEAG